MPAEIALGDIRLAVDPAGALVWAAEATVIVADLHLEKGSAFARKGALLPPYDTGATLDRLAGVIVRHGARRVVCLGDSFHDRAAHGRLAADDRCRLHALATAVDWIWVAGNHDPASPDGLGGRTVDELALGPLTLRHAARAGERGPELSGHFHPVARVATGPRRIARRCFIADARRAILPAFGAYAGGLDIGDPAIAGLFPHGFTAHLLGETRTFAFPSGHPGLLCG
ncbi:MAG: ligase-associated DNA damage response endonuclease PdeM [Rhodospirillales bacterium]